MTATVTYFAIVWAGTGDRWTELLVTRANGKQTSQTPTGTVYISQKAAKAALAEKNR